MKTKTKKKILLTVGILLAVAAALGIFFLCFYTIGVKPAETETITVGDGKTLRVGLISDTQLDPYKNGDHDNYRQNLIDALKVLKEQNVNLIVHAGDIGDMNSRYAYKTYKKALEEVFGDNIPKNIIIMGNHDNWWNTDWKHTKPKERNYTGVMNVSPWTHTVVNGFHFIAASPDLTENTEGYSQKVADWLDEQIKEAVKDTPDLPVFVITHHNPKYTAYGSDEWYDARLDTLFSKYPQVVSISGHSHYPIMDERSIYQKDYTAFTTQALAYVNVNEDYYFDAFRGGKTHLNPKDENYPMMEIMNVDEKGATIERWNVKENREEKADMRWTLSFPLNKDSFTYSLEQREAVNKAPEMSEDAVITFNPAVESTLSVPDENQNTLPGITFKAGSDDDFVHSYKVVLRGTREAEYYCLSDFASGISVMKDTVSLALDTELPEGEYTVKVYAIDSYGLMSENCAEGKIVLKR